MNTSSGPEFFKVCPNCKTSWKTVSAFLEDPEVLPSGYQVAFQDLEGGLFYFTHTVETCRTTMAVPVHAFKALSDRPFLSPRGERPECCPELCLRKSILDPCPAACECVWVREILQLIRKWKKVQAER